MASDQTKTFTTVVIGLLAFALLFFYLNAPDPDTRTFALFNLLLLGGFGTYAILGKGDSFFFEPKNGKDVVNDTAVGTIVGIVAIVVVIFGLGASGALHNLFGSVSPSETPTITSDVQLFIQVIQPLTETVLLLGIFNFVRKAVAGFSKQLANPIALLFSIFAFAVFHFIAYSAGNFPYNINGFVSFAISANGALAQLILGLVLLAGAAACRSWLVPFVAHLVYNSYAVARLWTGFGDTLVLLVLGSTIALTVIVYYRNGLSEIKTFKPERIWSYDALEKAKVGG